MHTHAKHSNFNCKWLPPLGRWMWVGGWPVYPCTHTCLFQFQMADYVGWVGRCESRRIGVWMEKSPQIINLQTESNHLDYFKSYSILVI